MTLTFGNTPVPYTVSWSGEQRTFIARCRHAKAQAICMEVAPGDGRPKFGTPHSQRQREVIAEGRCDLCGKSLANRTKVSLSHARMRTNGAEGPCVMQVEPLLHKECAATSMQFCPSLRRDIRDGKLHVRQVLRYRVQFAVMIPEFICEYVPDYQRNDSDRIVGHAKVELLSWKDRTEEWLQ